MSIFSQVAMRKPRHNTFDLSHDKKLTLDIGKLVPVACIDLVPGDRITISSSSLVRFQPLVAPVLHRFDVFIHYFFVPNRIMWDQWEEFITGGRDGDLAPSPPFINWPDPSGTGTVADYLGIPSAPAGSEQMEVSAFPDNGYCKIFEEYYKDNNLSDYEAPTLIAGNGNVESRMRSLPFQRSWYKDYFTSALPWTQRGPEATIPLGTVDTFQVQPDSEGTDWPNGAQILSNPADKPGTLYVGGSTPRTDIEGLVDPTSINDLRRAFRLQEFLEKNARGGARLTEVILSHFGVKSSDSRLQRPEFIGGMRTPIQISEVLQTSSTNDSQGPVDTPQGNMAGHGISVGNSGKFSYFAEEHGYFYAIMSVMPKPAYQQGIPRHFLRKDKYDYYWPSFANIGEQPIYNKELYWDADDGANDDVFGYAPRYSEYKYIPSTVHGDFRTNLDFWHAGRIFASRPTLGATFVQVRNAEVDRIFAVTSEDSQKLYAQVHHQITAKRPMPYFGVPTI